MQKTSFQLMNEMKISQESIAGKANGIQINVKSDASESIPTTL